VRNWISSIVIISTVLAPMACLGQIYDTSKGKLEFVGLKHWTPERIMKELGYKSFDQMHACAADLKTKLGFADAAVVITFTPDQKMHFLVSAVEPEEKQRVKRTVPAASVPTPDEWFPVTKAATEDFMGFVDSVPSIFRQKAPPVEGLPDVQPAKWWTDLRKLNRATDLSTALKVIAEDRDPTDRLVACAVLTNFPEKDEAWHGLMAAVRDQDEWIGVTAYNTLRWLARANPRKIDWKPVTAHLRHILNGTNLFSLPVVLATLKVTEVDPALAKELVGGNGGQMLLEYLRVHRPEERDLALWLLKRLSTQDFGTDVAKWQAWRNGLGEP
jgi:hypothetical protein